MNEKRVLYLEPRSDILNCITFILYSSLLFYVLRVYTYIPLASASCVVIAGCKGAGEFTLCESATESSISQEIPLSVKKSGQLWIGCSCCFCYSVSSSYKFVSFPRANSLSLIGPRKIIFDVFKQHESVELKI